MSGFKRADELLIERFEAYLREKRYAEGTIRVLIYATRRILRELGFPSEDKLYEAFRFKPYPTRQLYYRAFHRLQEFLEQSMSSSERDAL
ncbi:hypothetical protein DRH29_05020 [candidate division Kazan bacterium]|uniref:Integrase n=1 Tax=candidate division Kazan bacterium TaxID=2202143 RepID=A0A420ZBF9_UNCK3|nr:MAG: hypothetical protein DRH29_05020 [candidate division Kazan bacterium]